MAGKLLAFAGLLPDRHRRETDRSVAAAEPLAERVRKRGGLTLTSIGDIAARQRIANNDSEFVYPHEMLAELRSDNADLPARMRALHGVGDEHNDVATASLPENRIDETEKRVWFLFEILRSTNARWSPCRAGVSNSALVRPSLHDIVSRLPHPMARRL